MRMKFVINYEGHEIQYDEDEYSTSPSPRWIVKIGNEYLTLPSTMSMDQVISFLGGEYEEK